MDSINAKTEVIPDGPKRHILHIDDDPRLSNILGKLLEAHGYLVTHASEGVSGLLAFKENPEKWSAALVDLNLPHLRGNFLLLEMHRIRPDLPLIVFSGEPGENLGVYDQGATLFLKKTTVPAELLETLKILIK